jgi:formamidopyrimidine-DNA glycosylase
MPELPEVETVRRDLSKRVLGLTIKAVRVADARVIRGISPQQFAKGLTGRTIKDLTRRGKALVCHLDNGWYFIVQLMMTGQLVYARILPDVPLKETKVTFELSNGTYLNYNDQRLFGRLTLFPKLEDVKHFAILGPEPFDAAFNPKFIKESFKRRNVAIKTVLMDHTFVAGIGNIYASEILFRSGINPKRPARLLKLNEIERMHRMTIEVLEEAIVHRGSSMRNYRDGEGKKGTFNKLIRVYAREGKSCVCCQAPILKIVQGGRSTFFCKKCQK